MTALHGDILLLTALHGEVLLLTALHGEVLLLTALHGELLLVTALHGEVLLVTALLGDVLLGFPQPATVATLQGDVLLQRLPLPRLIPLLQRLAMPLLQSYHRGFVWTEFGENSAKIGDNSQGKMQTFMM